MAKALLISKRLGFESSHRRGPIFLRISCTNSSRGVWMENLKPPKRLQECGLMGRKWVDQRVFEATRKSSNVEFSQRFSWGFLANSFLPKFEGSFQGKSLPRNSRNFELRNLAGKLRLATSANFRKTIFFSILPWIHLQNLSNSIQGKSCSATRAISCFRVAQLR